MPRAWSTKDERKYDHIVESQKKQGTSAKRAKEIAARTVNKDRAQEGRTKEQLYNEARQLGIEGRSTMNKAQLQRAVAGKKGGRSAA
jgi:plasmid stabilization system protein ParE